MSSSLRLEELEAVVRFKHCMPVRNDCLYGSIPGLAVNSLVLATSSDNESFSGLLGPVGLREMASATLCFTPGMCAILNLYRRVFSFRSRSLVLDMASRERSLNKFRRGLWSTSMIRSSQPRVKNRALSRASTTARASPSTGAYRASAAWVKRLSTRVVFQPVRQQNG